AGFPRLIAQCDCEGRLAPLLDEDGRVHRLARVPGLVELLRVHEALGWDDLAVDAPDTHLSPIGVAPDPTIRAADTKVDLAHWECPAFEHAEPSLEQLGLGVGVEDHASRRIEDARHDDLPVAGGRHLQVSAVPHRRLLRLRVFCWAFSSSRRASRRWKLPS